MQDDVRHIKVDTREKKSEAKVGLVAVTVIAVLVATLWIVKARKHDPRDLEMMKAREAAIAPKDAVPELSLASTAPLPAGRQEEVSRALFPASTAAAACMAGIYATVFVDVTFGPDGKVKDAKFAAKNQLPVDQLLASTCFLEKLRAPTIAPGAGEVTAMFAVRNVPSGGAATETAKAGTPPAVPGR